MFLWMMPSPPSCAMAIASRASVTVSIAAEISGMLRVIERVRRVARETSRGTTSECAGTSRTSSNVSAFLTTRMRAAPARKNGLYPRGHRRRHARRPASGPRPRRPFDRAAVLDYLANVIRRAEVGHDRIDGSEAPAAPRHARPRRCGAACRSPSSSWPVAVTAGRRARCTSGPTPTVGSSTPTSRRPPRRQVRAAATPRRRRRIRTRCARWPNQEAELKKRQQERAKQAEDAGEAARRRRQARRQLRPRRGSGAGAGRRASSVVYRYNEKGERVRPRRRRRGSRERQELERWMTADQLRPIAARLPRSRQNGGLAGPPFCFRDAARRAPATSSARSPG